jgi:hypothetical protein
MNFDKLKAKCSGKTLLGVGPVTKNTIDAALFIANHSNVPLQLIPSRRQVDSRYFGGGYVMDTETFSKYVRERDINKNIILARDHGGPYQGSKIDPILEVDDAIESFETDIANDFNILHIDPSLNPKLNGDFQLLSEQVVQLLYNCEDFAYKNNKKIIYEVGTDGHGTKPSDPEQIKKLIEYTKKHDHSNNIKFIVANTGTCVKEKCNVGKLHVSETLKFIEICNQNDLMLKEHNNDYNDFSTLSMHRNLGVHASNIAPEYGVEETKELIRLLKQNELYHEYEDFVKLAYNSKKWEKWMINGEHPDREYLATICGHYIMETLEVKEIKKKLNTYTEFSLDTMLQEAVRNVMYKHLQAFGWFR